MAVWQIETTVTTINTNLSCTVMLSYISTGSDLGYHHWWQRVAGRYRFGPKSGWWAYFGNGIILSRTTDMNNPLVELAVNHLLVLSGVSLNFAEKMLPMETIRGFGRHFLTSEDISWEMKLAHFPLRK